MATPTGNFSITAPLRMPDFEGIYEQVDKNFRDSIQAPLSGFRLFAGNEFPIQDIGIRQYTWHDIGEMEGVKISMDWPTPAYDAVSTSAQNVQLPMFGKSIKWDGRDLSAFLRQGPDFMNIPVRKMAQAMRKELNKYLLLGAGAGNPGPATGLLNHPDVQTIDNATDWGSSPLGMVNDVNEAINAIVSKGYPSANGFGILINGADSDLFTGFLSSSNPDAQVTDKLNPQIVQGRTGELTDPNVDASGTTDRKAYVIDLDRYFDVGVPTTANIIGEFEGSFGLETALSTQYVDPRHRSLEINWFNSMVPRVVEPETIVEISYDRA